MARPYHWFQGASVDLLMERLVNHPGCRLEVHQDGQQMTFLVVPGDAVVPPGIVLESHNTNHINDSHICPPDCPG